MNPVCLCQPTSKASMLGRGRAPSIPLIVGVSVSLLTTLFAGCVDAKKRRMELNPGFDPIYYGAVVAREELPPHKWTKFVAVAGQPEPVPAEWVSTPEGRYAHSIVLPDPLPKDSGYKWTMSATEYFLHLCEKEAGEFIYRSEPGVAGFLFDRPPSVPDDPVLADRYRLEAPIFEAQYQNIGYNASERGLEYVSPPSRTFEYLEEPIKGEKEPEVVFVSGYEERTHRLTNREVRNAPVSKYMVTWRGIRRKHDREHGIGGFELIILDRETGEVLGFLRDFGISGRRGPIYWLNAAQCPQLAAKSPRPEVEQTFRFVSSVLRPVKAPVKGRRFGERP